jgi:flagellar biosynthesis/type III secretory pathway M-ring protein FliF/YscJ
VVTPVLSSGTAIVTPINVSLLDASVIDPLMVNFCWAKEKSEKISNKKVSRKVREFIQQFFYKIRKINAHIIVNVLLKQKDPC